MDQSKWWESKMLQFVAIEIWITRGQDVVNNNVSLWNKVLQYRDLKFSTLIYSITENVFYWKTYVRNHSLKYRCSKSGKMTTFEMKSDQFTRRKIQGFGSGNFAECLKMLQKFKVRENSKFWREKWSIYKKENSRFRTGNFEKWPKIASK